MSSAETKLAQAFAADQPPARDYAFALSVLERMERRRAWNELMDGLPIVLAASGLLWLLAPTIGRAVQAGLAALNSQSFVAAIVLVVTLLLFVFAPRGETTR